MIPRTILDQLHYIKIVDQSLDLTYFPDFFILGPQRTGTTWLATNIQLHPQIMVPTKEIFFFNNIRRPHNPKFRSNTLDWYLALFRSGEKSDFLERRRIFCLAHFGEGYSPSKRGEACASYALLDETIIREIHILNPHLRLIMFIRNPIDRAWSHAKKDLARNKGRRVEEVTNKELEKFFTQPYQRRCAQYTENIDRWLRYFPQSSMFLGRFDDITTRPVRLLLDVLCFLGVRADKKYILPSANQVINPTESAAMPCWCRTFLQSLYAQEIRNLEARFSIRHALAQSLS